MNNPSLLCVAGLPRSGSTLMCQLLAEHPEVYSTGHSSPLANTLKRIRSGLSEDVFMLSQLDVDFELGHQRIRLAMQGFISGWFAETDKPVVVDKNRGWLADLALLSHLIPDFKMVVCVRALDQILGSIEARHQQTPLLDFPDGLANMTPFERAEKLFAAKGVVGRTIRLIQDLQDVSAQLQQQLYYVLYEDLMARPVEVMAELYRWIGVSDHQIDPHNLNVRPHETDSHYRFKYPHATRSSLAPARTHLVSPRIMHELKKQFHWFYHLFYPGQTASHSD
jgi:sulfotransferase